MSIVKNTALISVITLVSRVLGYFRDVAIASFLGTGPINDAFIAAFKFANLFRNVFAEGALTAAFLPIFAGQLSKEGRKRAIATAAIVQSMLILLLLLFITFVTICMPFILELTTPGFRTDDQKFFLAVALGRITFPYLFFISLSAFYGSILHSIEKFIPFAATSIIFNVSMIIFALYWDWSETKAHAISYGLLVAGLLELLWMIFFLKKHNMLIPIQLPKLTEEIKRLLKRFGSGLLGSGITQINTWVDMIIASLIPGAMSYMYYAERIMQLPLALVATAMSTALLPALAKHLSERNMVKVRNMQNMALNVSAFCLIPVTLFFFAFAQNIIQLLLERGMFDIISTQKTSEVLSILAFGIPAFASIKLFSNIFYAAGDTKTPAQIAGLGLGLNIIVSLSLLERLQHTAIAVASITAAWFIAITLIWVAKLKKYYCFDRDILYCIALYLVASLVSVASGYYMRQKIGLILLCLASALIYLTICFFYFKFKNICKINVIHKQ